MFAIDGLYQCGESKSGVALHIYPERAELHGSPAMPNVGHWASDLPAPLRKKALRGDCFVEQVHKYGLALITLPKSKIVWRLLALRKSLRRQGSRPELTSQAFALIRELSERCLGKRHYDVQVYAGWVMLNGMVVEMETGEGKTLAVSLAAATAALAGTPVHVLTVNDYLAERDAKALLPLYQTLGLTIGVVTGSQGPDERRSAYACDITYCTAKELAFDYLRDRMIFDSNTGNITRQIDRLYGHHSRSGRLLLKGLHFAIVDECDSVLIDEANTPLVLAGPTKVAGNTSIYLNSLKLAKSLQAGTHFTKLHRTRKIELTAMGTAQINRLLIVAGNSRPDSLINVSMITTALCALYLYQRDRDYLVRADHVQIIDENTGRVRPDHSWERGLHQMIEAKEGCPISGNKQTLSRISFQRLFRRYLRFSGTTGTASEVTRELRAVYGLGVVRIPTHRPVRRKYLKERVFTNEQDKLSAIVARVEEVHKTGRPILLATRTVEASQILSQKLIEHGLVHRLLSARQDKNEAEVVAKAGERASITVATNMAGRGTDIALGRDVLQLGGLHVIATERHEARRIDRQLYGRCARQGNPGSCELFTSSSDHLIGLFCPSWMIEMLNLRLCQNPALQERMIRLFSQIAQWRAERYQSELRRDLLRSDENMAQSMGFTGPPE